MHPELHGAGGTLTLSDTADLATVYASGIGAGGTLTLSDTADLATVYASGTGAGGTLTLSDTADLAGKGSCLTKPSLFFYIQLLHSLVSSFFCDIELRYVSLSELRRLSKRLTLDQLLSISATVQPDI